MEYENLNFTLYFNTLSVGSFGFDLHAKADSEHVVRFIKDIVNTFSTWPEPDKVHFNCIQEMTEELKDVLISHFQKYVNSNPQFHKVIKKIKEIPTNEYFLVFPYKTNNSFEEVNHWQSMLQALNTAANQEDLIKQLDERKTKFDEIFGFVSEKYDIKVFGESEKKTIIGVRPTQEAGSCRFCKTRVSDGAKFKKIAHSISEALGNKCIVTADECDECNGKFGRTIEPHLIRYLDIYRVFFRISGKNGIPELRFKDGGNVHSSLPDNDEKMMVMCSQNITETDNSINILYKSFDKINEQKIFKSLCKIALSVLDPTEISNFDLTIQWLLSEEKNEKDLHFSIATLITNHFTKHPVLTTYIRKNNSESEYPHLVAELQFGVLMFIYIVPYSKKDHKHFNILEDFESLCHIFSHYNKIKDRISFSDMTEHNDKEFQFNVKFVKPEDKNS